MAFGAEAALGRQRAFKEARAVKVAKDKELAARREFNETTVTAPGENYKIVGSLPTAAEKAQKEKNSANLARSRMSAAKQAAGRAKYGGD